jgi:hypothetical protein
VNYANLARALEFYQERGYVYLDDVPWTVFHAAYYATKPDGAKDVRIFNDSRDLRNHLDDSRVQVTIESHDERFLVASAEQSFIQMMLDGQPIKRAIAVTPCYRAEPKVDTLHRPYFMKAELINAQDVDEGHLIHMIGDAKAFFEQFFAVRIVKTNACDFGEPSFDIVEKGSRFELGSYGIRRMEISGQKLAWIYGTACAEPRLSTAIAKHLKYVGR